MQLSRIRLENTGTPMKEQKTLRIVTYNIHRCVGLDRRRRPQRIVSVLQQIEPDIVGLQEVVSVRNGRPEDDQSKYIADALQMEYKMGITRTYRGGVFGNVLLSRLPFLSTRTFDLSHPGREERGCLHVDFGISKNHVLHVYNVHFGVAFRERRHQARRMMNELMSTFERQHGMRILLGDFNDWTRRLPTRLFSSHFSGEDIRRSLRTRRTYPGILPFIHLDHIYYDDKLVLRRVRIHKSPTSLIASDHLPLVADFTLHPAHRIGENRAVTSMTVSDLPCT